MTNLTSLIIMGAGGLARELYDWIAVWQPVSAFYVDHPSPGPHLYGLPIITHLEAGMRVVVAVGDPALRRRFRMLALSAGAQLADPIRCPGAYVSARARIAPGVVIAPGARISPDVELEQSVFVNYNATVGHDTLIGADTFIAPLAAISGNVCIKPGAYVGTGAAVRDRVRVGLRSVIGAGAAVVRDVDDGTTVMGVPAKTR